MSASRVARKGRARTHRRRLWAFLSVAAVVLVAVAVAASALAGRAAQARRGEASGPAEATAGLALSAEATPVPGTARQVVEVPDVVGKSLAEAEMVMSLAGFAVERETDTTASPDPDRRITRQKPAAGTKLHSGATVVLVHAREASAKDSTPSTQYVVVLDPGHQRRSDLGLEPIGPGSPEKKAKVTGGAQGIATRVPEYEFALALSKKVCERLEARGVRVVMTRSKHDVHLSNIERANLGNRAGADLVVRVHADSNVDRTLRGASTLHPSSNRWTKPIVKRSRAAARCVQSAMVEAAGARDLGLRERGDITGFNWSKVPVILVEAGFLSNASEDRLLNSTAYQDKLADGIADGVIAYLED